ncbi:MAG: 16S rRNA (adenine(1518)-N(6)/adenine(1519)-N(6))-dimethyltransferase [Bacteroidales bacterium]|nr:16S rRNA (adenine(1518)-N(6)/adenine(1519)-N(6))-dimethyltransferase [Bacteroidales bacterium]
MPEVRPKKALGQHFLTDQRVAERIAATLDDWRNLPVLEVGPGMGVLTRWLLEKGHDLTVVEIDAESVDYLQRNFPSLGPLAPKRENKGEDGALPPVSPGVTLLSPLGSCPDNQGEASSNPLGACPDNQGEASSSPLGSCPDNQGEASLSPLGSKIIEGDFLEMDLKKIFGEEKFCVIGNYPYNISSQIFFKVLDYKDQIPCCNGMLQREVAQRLAAKEGSKTRGILSVLLQAWYNVEYLFTVDENVFNPPPKVKSGVIKMVRNDVIALPCDERLFRTVVKTTFGQRRKMLRSSIKPLLPPGIVLPDSQLLTMRPEQLSNEQFYELTNLISQLRQ